MRYTLSRAADGSCISRNLQNILQLKQKGFLVYVLTHLDDLDCLFAHLPMPDNYEIKTNKKGRTIVRP
jgi:hypothetical protein